MPRSRARRILGTVVLLVGWGLITHGTFAGSGDEPHYQVIAHSIAFDHDVDVANNYRHDHGLSAEGPFAAEAHARHGRGGVLRPVHDIGMPLLFAPYYAVAHTVAARAAERLPARWLQRARLNRGLILRHLLSLAMIVVTAGIGLLLLDVFAEMTGDYKRALLWAALLVLSPPLLSHSFLFFTEITSAFLALWIFLRLRRESLDMLTAFIAGLATGMLLLVHVRNAGLVLGLVGLAVYRLRQSPRARLAAFLAGAATLVLVRTAVTWHFWGTLVTTPLARPGSPSGVGAGVSELVTRIAGWLVDQEHGLLPYAPIFLLLPAGWVSLHRRDRRLARELSFAVGACVMVMALPWLNPYGWRGGWSPAARFLVPVVPLLAIALAAFPLAYPRTPSAVRILVVVQVALNSLFWQRPKLLWNDGIGSSALAGFLDGSGTLAAWLPSIPLRFDALHAAVAAAAIGLWIAVGRVMGSSMDCGERPKRLNG